MNAERKGGQATKDELAKNLFRAWYVAACGPGDSIYFTFIEAALERHHGTVAWRKYVADGIEILERDGNPVPERMRRVLE